jgi:hypothetical protein
MNDNSTTETAQRLTSIRTTGSRGTPILMHRALRNISLTPMSLLSIVFLPLFFDALLWVKLDDIMHLWGQAFAFWAERLSLNENLAYTDIQLFGRTFSVIYLSLPVADISAHSAWMNILICMALYFLSEFIPGRLIPLVTLFRACLLVQMSSSVYCFLSHYTFPYDIAVYLTGVLSLGAYLLFIISPVLALIYYIFDFSFIKKLMITALMIAYFIVLIPFLYTLHALVISLYGLLMVPVLYLMFGPLLVTLMFVSFYAWAMTRDNTAK